MAKDNLHRIIEALLFANDSPLNLDKLKEILDGTSKKEIREAIADLQKYYDDSGSAIKVTELAGGFQTAHPGGVCRNPAKTLSRSFGLSPYPACTRNVGNYRL